MSEEDGGAASDGSDWEFQEGETLIEQSDMGSPQMPGAEGMEPTTEYIVKRRLYDVDEDTRMYYLEWERDTPGGPSVENQLYNADLVRLHYQSVEADADQPGGGDDAE